MRGAARILRALIIGAGNNIAIKSARNSSSGATFIAARLSPDLGRTRACGCRESKISVPFESRSREIVLRFLAKDSRSTGALFNERLILSPRDRTLILWSIYSYTFSLSVAYRHTSRSISRPFRCRKMTTGWPRATTAGEATTPSLSLLESNHSSDKSYNRRTSTKVRYC